MVGATVEINRSKNLDEDSTILVQRYTSICPVCGWMIKLDRGEPDFPRRIVGRCEEHPREHVFSFDRITKQGKALHRDVATPSAALHFSKLNARMRPLNVRCKELSASRSTDDSPGL